MDAAAIVTLVTTAAGGAAGEAGRQAWASLLELVRRATGRAEPERVDPQDAEAVRALSTRIAERAAADPEFRQALETWAAERPRTQVTNTVGGSARITGPVIQAGEIKGDINLG
jgi:hypothetical protein